MRGTAQENGERDEDKQMRGANGKTPAERRPTGKTPAARRPTGKTVLSKSSIKAGTSREGAPTHAPSAIPVPKQSRIASMAYLPRWFFNARFRGKTAPLQTVLFVSNVCNLACKHCESATHAGTISKSFAQIETELRYAYGTGARFVDFEGGEPTIWRDGSYRINDLIALARSMGFFSTTVTTNAQLPFDGLAATSVWVSLDGTREYHDEIRGPGAFDRAMSNIEASGHPAVSVNMTINRINKDCVLDVLDIVRESPCIQKMSFSFHTPYPGTEHMKVDWPDRVAVLDALIERKRAGYPIMNSASAMELMKTNAFEKNCWVASFILADGTRLDECPGKSVGICDECGFGMGAEMHSVFSFKPDTIRAGLDLRMA